MVEYIYVSGFCFYERDDTTGTKIAKDVPTFQTLIDAICKTSFFAQEMVDEPQKTKIDFVKPRYDYCIGK